MMNKKQIEEKILRTIDGVREDAESLVDVRDGIDLMAILYWVDNLHTTANRIEDLVGEYEDAED